MNKKTTFCGLTATLPDGWLDVTSDLPDGAPTTLARARGVGALQFTVAKYHAGTSPNIAERDLQRLLDDFAKSRNLGSSLGARHGLGLHPYVCDDFQLENERVRVYYLTNGKDLALITYVSQTPNSSETTEELTETMHIVESIDFI